jgi:Tfp pilus assembly protein PilF
MAAIWQQIGMVHRNTRQVDQAEHAYWQSLALQVQQKNQSGEASTLSELGNLYRAMGRLEKPRGHGRTRFPSTEN